MKVYNIKRNNHSISLVRDKQTGAQTHAV